MTKEEYQQWAEHPQTKQFHQFLLDYRKVIMEKWAHGLLHGEIAISERATAQFAFLLANLGDESIKDWYAVNQEVS